MEVMSHLLVRPASAPFGHLLGPLHSQREHALLIHCSAFWRFSSGFQAISSNSRLSFPSHGFYKDTPHPEMSTVPPTDMELKQSLPQHFQASHPSYFFIHTLHQESQPNCLPYYCPNALCFPASFLVQEPGKPPSQKPFSFSANPPARTGSLSPGPQRKYTSPFPAHSCYTE